MTFTKQPKVGADEIDDISMSLDQTIVAERRIYQGAPTIFVNDKAIHGGMVVFRNTSLVQYPDKELVEWQKPSLRKISPEIIMPWIDLQVGLDLNLAAIRNWFEQSFSKYPNALGACRIALQPSMDWCRAHPDEMTLYDRPLDWSKARVRDASWASQVWLKDSAELIEKLCCHLHNVFRGRVILYQVGGGHSGENGPISTPCRNDSWFCGDFSTPMLAYFRHKLKEHYQENIDQLRRAWGNSGVTFENAMPPDQLERLQTECFSLRSPRHCQTADYCRTISEAVEECVIIWAKAIKRGTNNESLTASPMGSVLDTGLNSFMLHQLNKNTFSKAAASPHLDMFQSPSSYALRDLGKGDTSAMIPLGMLRLAGKIWLRDFDSRTSVVANARDGHPARSLWRAPSTCWEDIQMLKRDIAYSLIKGGAFWWHEIEEGMYKLPEHISIAKRFQTIGQGIVHADRSMVSGLAVFFDNEANFHQSSSNRLIYAMNYEARRLHWTHAGVACEVYHLDDAKHSSMPNHKVIMITNAFCMTDAQTEAITELARRNSATVIWLMAPGIQGPDGFDIERTSRITGFSIRSVEIEALPRIALLSSGSHPWSHPTFGTGDTNDTGEELRMFGAGQHDSDDSGARCIGPLFYADVSEDADATVLGMLEAINKPGLVVRQMDGWSSVYCAAPYVHNALLRLIAKDTGAHIYINSDDLVHVSADLLLVHAKQEGIKRISWPTMVESVVDLVTGCEIAQNCQEWSLEMKKHETHFLFAGLSSKAQEICKKH